MYPIVNLNGSAVDDLLETRCDAIHAVEKAMKAMQLIAPNGRDYQQTTSHDAYQAAMDRYSKQFALLDRLRNELYDEIEFIDKQRNP